MKPWGTPRHRAMSGVVQVVLNVFLRLLNARSALKEVSARISLVIHKLSLPSQAPQETFVSYLCLSFSLELCEWQMGGDDHQFGPICLGRAACCRANKSSPSGSPALLQSLGFLQQDAILLELIPGQFGHIVTASPSPAIPCTGHNFDEVFCLSVAPEAHRTKGNSCICQHSNRTTPKEGNFSQVIGKPPCSCRLDDNNKGQRTVS